MRICALSDNHNNLIDIPECEVLILAGDVSMNGGPNWFTNIFIPYLKKQSNKYDVCLIVFGNHDDNIYMDGKLDKIRKSLPSYIKILDNESFEYKGINFYGSPNCRYIPGFLNTHSELELKNIFSSIPLNTDILITHSPPHGIGDTVDGEWIHFGSESLLQKSKEIKPRIHIFGHVHTGKRYSKEENTEYYNVSIVDEDYNIAYKPTIIEVI